MNIHLAQGKATQIALKDKSVHCIIFSPPYYGQRDYATGEYKEDELGAESHPDCLGWANDDPCGTCFVCNVLAYTRECWRVLRDDGSMWINLGDSYAGSGGAGEWSKRKAGNQEYAGQRDNANRIVKSKRISRGKGSGRWGGGDIKVRGIPAKNLIGIPWRCALALQSDGWILRSAPPWIKGNTMPESASDRPNTAHEYWFQFTKQQHYYSDMYSVKQPSTDQRGRAAGFIRKNSGPLVPGQRAKQHRSDREETNPSITRNWRTSDISRLALRNHIDHMLDVYENGGMLINEAGLPEVMFFNTRGYSGAHFASFNPDMVEPLIKYATSEMGVCPFCGAPWKRVVKKGYRAPVDEELIAEMEAKGIPRQKGNLYGGAGIREPQLYAQDPDRTVGWEPDCNCTQDVEIIESIINFSTSDGGVCSQCYSPYERIVIKNRIHRDQLPEDDPRYRPGRYAKKLLEIRNTDGEYVSGAYTQTTSHGWKPSCDCRKEGIIPDPIPAVVLDPFSGTGVTAMVANQLGRVGIGLELSFEYIEMAIERTMLDKYGSWVNDNIEEPETTQETKFDDLPLFGG